MPRVIWHDLCLEEVNGMVNEVAGSIRRQVQEIREAYERGERLVGVEHLGRNDDSLKNVWEKPLIGDRLSCRTYYLLRDDKMGIMYVDPNKRRTQISRSTYKLLRRRRKDMVRLFSSM
jgi:hypothetical protein